jgi:hypothetical protein
MQGVNPTTRSKARAASRCGALDGYLIGRSSFHVSAEQLSVLSR